MNKVFHTTEDLVQAFTSIHSKEDILDFTTENGAPQTTNKKDETIFIWCFFPNHSKDEDWEAKAVGENQSNYSAYFELRISVSGDKDMLEIQKSLTYK